ncbi:hypothetical protein XENTR_v10011008 [Xenopus tropicalis]|nr:hypothetical protein XENTR_v10011008 [Xenopus tropicalis]
MKTLYIILKVSLNDVPDVAEDKAARAKAKRLCRSYYMDYRLQIRKPPLQTIEDPSGHFLKTVSTDGLCVYSAGASP